MTKIPYKPCWYVRFYYRFMTLNWPITITLFALFVTSVALDLYGQIQLSRIFLFSALGLLAFVVLGGIVAVWIKNAYLKYLAYKYNIPLDEIQDYLE